MCVGDYVIFSRRCGTISNGF